MARPTAVLLLAALIAALAAWAGDAAKRCPALSLKVRAPKTARVGEIVPLRIKLKNTCKGAAVPNVQLALELPPGVEVVAVGDAKPPKAGGKNHTRALYEGGRLLLGLDDGPGPYTLQGRRAVRRSLKVRIQPCSYAAAATKIHFVAEATTPDIPGSQPTRASAQVLVKPGKGQWGSTNCPPAANITSCTELITVAGYNGGPSTDYYGCTFSSRESPAAGQFACGPIYSAIGVQNMTECLEYCSQTYSSPAIAFDEHGGPNPPYDCFCSVGQVTQTFPDRTRLYIRGGSTQLPIVDSHDSCGAQ